MKRNRTIKLSEKVLKFKANLLEDQKIRLEEKSINCETININDLKNITEEVYAFIQPLVKTWILFKIIN